MYDSAMETTSNQPTVKPITVARADFLRPLIPQLLAGGFTALAARYAVELDRLDKINNAQ